jgi:hypothetical protein
MLRVLVECRDYSDGMVCDFVASYVREFELNPFMRLGEQGKTGGLCRLGAWRRLGGMSGS